MDIEDHQTNEPRSKGKNMKILNALCILLVFIQNVNADVKEDSLNVYFEQFKKYDLQNYWSAINLIDKFKNIPLMSLAPYLEGKIMNPSDNLDRPTAIKITGILKIKRLKKIIEWYHGRYIDIDSELSTYLYLYFIENDEMYLNYIKYIVEAYQAKNSIPIFVTSQIFNAFELLSWVADREILDYLEKIDSSDFDGALSEDYGLALDKIKFLIKRSE